MPYLIKPRKPLRKSPRKSKKGVYVGKPVKVAPPRFLPKTQYKNSRALTNSLRNISETQIIPLEQFNQSAPHAITGNSYCYMKGFCTGIGTVPSQLTNFESLGGFNYPTTGQSAIRGNSVYHRKLSTLFQVDMSPAQSTTSITEFRVIQFVQKRQASINLMDPEVDLFLETDGSYMGWNTPQPTPPLVGGPTGPKLMVAKTNKQKYIILKDFKFTLTSPMIQGGTQTSQSYNGRYPSMKRFALNLPVYKKMTLDVNNHPADYNFTTCCVILARPLANTNLANDWSVSTMNGVSTYTDF